MTSCKFFDHKNRLIGEAEVDGNPEFVVCDTIVWIRSEFNDYEYIRCTSQASIKQIGEHASRKF